MTTMMRTSQWAPRAASRAGRFAGVAMPARLGIVAALSAVIGAFVPSVGAATMAFIATGSWTVAAAVALLGVPFLAITMPTMAIWLIGAVQTDRTIRRLA